MIKQLLLGSILGGLCLFVWLSLSWAVLPLHRQQFHAFPDQPAMQQALRAAQPEAGIYLLPGIPNSAADGPAVSELAKLGPTVSFMVVQPGGYDPLDFSPYLKGTLYSMLAALCVSVILIGMGRALPEYANRVRICALIGVTIALAGPMTSGAFFMYPPVHLALEVGDHIIGWTLAGLVIAWATQPAPLPKESTA